MKSGNSSARGARCREGEIAPTSVGLAYRVVPRGPFFSSRNVTRVVSEMDFRVNATRAVSEMALPPSASLSLEEWRYRYFIT